MCLLVLEDAVAVRRAFAVKEIIRKDGWQRIIFYRFLRQKAGSCSYCLKVTTAIEGKVNLRHNEHDFLHHRRALSTFLNFHSRTRPRAQF